MSISTIKIELVKQLLSTTDKNIINHIKAVLSVNSNNWFEELPDKIKSSVTRGLNDSVDGKTISHEEAMKHFKKWVKK